jgi:DNA-directed RNA polymerase specialized sigma24 family protein
MSDQRRSTSDSLIPRQDLPDGAEAFSERLHGLLDGKEKDDATVEEAFAGLEPMFELIAAGLYSLASMLVGEGEDSVQLVETAVATAEVSSSDSAAEARKSSRMALSRAAVAMLDRRDPGCLAAPDDLEHANTCIEDDDLDAASEYGEELAKLMSGPDRERTKKWLASLSVPTRVIFVLRAVAGFTSQETASLLAASGATGAAGWGPDAVREIFRQGLCSLASQLIHATTSR